MDQGNKTETPSASSASQYAQHLIDLAMQVKYNLQHQHRWSELVIRDTSPVTLKPLARPMIVGLPPKRIYMHPDEQMELLKFERQDLSAHSNPDGKEEKYLMQIKDEPEREWVLPTRVDENWSLEAISEILDAVDTVPQTSLDKFQSPSDRSLRCREASFQWRGPLRPKRVLMAPVHNDSTIVYYFVFDGIVKPRQN